MKPQNFSLKSQNTKKSKIFGAPKTISFRGFGSRKSIKDFLGNKRGVSDVIATVMLILVTIVAGVFIGTVVIPMIKDKLSNSDCVKTVGKLNIIDNRAYSCYNDGETSLMIEKKSMENLKLEGIAVSLSGNGKSFLFKIKNGTQLENVTMSDGSLILNIPDNGEARTYNFITAAGFDIIKAEIAPILKGEKICDKSVFDVPRCQV